MKHRIRFENPSTVTVLIDEDEHTKRERLLSMSAKDIRVAMNDTSLHLVAGGRPKRGRSRSKNPHLLLLADYEEILYFPLSTVLRKVVECAHTNESRQEENEARQGDADMLERTAAMCMAAARKVRAGIR